LELKVIQQRVGITFIYVTHDQEEALTMSNRIAVMHQGRVLQVGDPEQIYEHPASRFVADFIGETNFMTGKITRIDARSTTLLVDDRISVQAPKRNDLHAGQSATIAVRPEKLTLTRQSAKGESIPGTIEEVIYIGTDIRYCVRISDSTTLMIREQNSSGDPGNRFQNGDRIFVNWVRENATLLTE